MPEEGLLCRIRVIIYIIEYSILQTYSNGPRLTNDAIKFKTAQKLIERIHD